jgi:hypothetical protein
VVKDLGVHDEVLARAANLPIARGAFDAAVKMYPGETEALAANGLHTAAAEFTTYRLFFPGRNSAQTSQDGDPHSSSSDAVDSACPALQKHSNRHRLSRHCYVPRN